MTVRARVLACLLTVLSLPTLVSAHLMPTVLPDRILTGGPNLEFVPRFATYLPNSLSVPAGQTVTLPASATYDAIEVAGVLKCPASFSLYVTHLTILPGGHFECGTVDAPVEGVIVIRNVPIDTAKDPYQFGNGILNFGSQTRVGRLVTPWGVLSADVLTGAKTLSLPVPADWRVGDELDIPDTRQGVTRREPKLFIAAKTATSLTLSQALTFEHKAILDPNGVLVLRPRVLNLTRGLVVMSENPTGTRGHTINLGMDATADIRGNLLADLGRTCTSTLNNTKADASGAILSVGTCQAGRYTSHDHHSHGVDQVFVDNVLRGGKVSKWGHAIHQTSYTQVEDNIAVDFFGAGFVTEDGNERFNVFRHNFAAYSVGNGKNTFTNIRTTALNAPGVDGTGFWFHGIENTVEQNEGWRNGLAGIAHLQVEFPAGLKVASVPGGVPDTAYNAAAAFPVSIADNIGVGNLNGEDVWGNPLGFTVYREVMANNANFQLVQGPATGSVKIVDALFIAQGGQGQGIQSSEGYTSNLELVRGYVGGCDKGFNEGIARTSFLLTDTVLQCKINIHMGAVFPGMPATTVLTRVTHKPLGTFPKQYLTIWPTVWNGQLPYPQMGGSDPYAFTPQTGTRIVIDSWQGDGKTYRVYMPQQMGTTPAWIATSLGNWLGCPELVTWGECWTKYGFAFGREAIDPAQTTTLDGLINGRVREGGPTALPPPRAPMVFPNQYLPVVPSGGVIRLNFALTGDPVGTDPNRILMQVDGAAPVLVTTASSSRLATAMFNTKAIASGTHTVTTWRVTPTGEYLPASQLSFTYSVN